MPICNYMTPVHYEATISMPRFYVYCQLYAMFPEDEFQKICENSCFAPNTVDSNWLEKLIFAS